MQRACWSWLLVLAFAGCAAPYASRALGVSAREDASVPVFRTDKRSSWTSFRLGGGLNVVVANPALPSEFAWEFRTGPEGISSSPVVDRNVLLVDANDHRLYALDAATGVLRWRYEAENELMTQPLYESGRIFVGTGNSDCSAYFPPSYVVMGLGANRIEAIDASTGREIWSQGIAGTGMPTALLLGREIIHADGAGTILALDARDGSYVWHTVVPSFFSMTAVIDGGDGRVYVPGSFPNAIYALDATNGSVVWRHGFPRYFGGISDGPMASTASLLVGMYLEPLARGPQGWTVQYGSFARQHVYAIRKRDGEVVWDRKLANVRGIAPAYNESAIPLIYRNRVYIGSAVAPIVSALDLATGRVLWQRRVDGPVKGGLVARGGTVYLGDLSGVLWAVDAATGRVIGKMAEDMHFNVGSPIIVNDTIIDTSREGVLAVPLRWIRSGHR